MPLVQGRGICLEDGLLDYERSERATMKAITVMQPYAHLICSGAKLVENRTWATNYRGPLLIHAGKSEKWLSTYEPLPENMDFGAIIGVCMLADCVSEYAIRGPNPRRDVAYLRNHRHVEGPWCWVLKDPRRFPTPIKYRGFQKLWDVPIENVHDRRTSAYLVAEQLKLVGNWPCSPTINYPRYR
jgi:activating signal cointegrator 1